MSNLGNWDLGHCLGQLEIRVIRSILMKIILTKDIKKLGKAGDVLDVSEGYARNFLLRSQSAVVAGNTELKKLEQVKQQQKTKSEAEAKSLKKSLDMIASQTYHFALAGDKNGHLYAGLKESEILAKITEGGTSLQKSLRLVDYSPLKTSGEHTVRLEIHGSRPITAKISIKTAS